MVDTVVRTGGRLRFSTGDPVDSGMVRHGTGTVESQLAANIARLDAADAAWATYTPTDSGITVGNGVRVAAFKQMGKTVYWRWSLTCGTTTTFNAALNAVGLPATAVNVNGYQPAPLYMFDNGSRHWIGVARVDPGTTLAYLFHSDAAGGGLVTSAAPFAVSNGDLFMITGVYEAA